MVRTKRAYSSILACKEGLRVPGLEEQTLVRKNLTNIKKKKNYIFSLIIAEVCDHDLPDGA